MNLLRASTTLSLVVPLALIVPACAGEPADGAGDPSSIGSVPTAYVSIPPPDENSNSESNSGGTSSSGGASSGSSGGGSSAPTLGVTFEDCYKDSRRAEMRAALGDILANWSAFDANLSAYGLTTDHDCMYNRLTSNGNVKCDDCSNPDLAGHSMMTGKTANVCKSWASGIESKYAASTNSRQVCWASIIMHEFGHTCVRFESGAEDVDNAARDTLDAIYGLSLDLDSECNEDM